MGILKDIIRQKEIYQERYEWIKKESERLEAVGKKEAALILKGQMMEMEYVYYQFFGEHI